MILGVLLPLTKDKHMRILYITLINIALFSCETKSSKEKLTIIDNIVLGESKEEFQKTLKSLNVPNKNFYTSWILFRPDDTIIQKINFHYTNQFNFDEYIDKENTIEHIGVFVPEFLNNKNLTSFTILLGHTNKAITPNDTLNKKSRYIQLRQDVAKVIIKKIEDLFTLRYGKPETQIDTSRFVDYYLLFENSIQKNSMESSYHYTLKWETEYYTVTFFSGTDLNAYYIPGKGYSQSSNRLYSNLSQEALFGNQQPCLSVPYIKYELNTKGFELLGLKNINL